MKRVFEFLFLLPVALIVLTVAVGNRQLVTIFLDPFAGPKRPAVRTTDDYLREREQKGDS